MDKLIVNGYFVHCFFSFGVGNVALFWKIEDADWLRHPCELLNCQEL